MRDFTAMRAWKLLQQVGHLKARGISFLNLRGFLNLLAFACRVDFVLTPEDIGTQAVYLHSDLMLPMRHDVRAAMDRHAARAPRGDGWVGVHRQLADSRFDEIQGREEYFSVAHGEVLACVESALRPWWVRFCDGIPEEQWPRDIVCNVLKAVLGWLPRLLPAFEERYHTLPPGPVVFRFRFPELCTFRQRPVGQGQTMEAPTLVVEDGEIVVGCGPRYLKSFLEPGNLGDRLMITAMARGLEMLCGNTPLPNSTMEEWVRSVAGSDNHRFLKMRLSRTPHDLVYDSVALPELRLPMPEDLAWSELELPWRAGYDGATGSIPGSQVPKLLKAAVDVVWKRVRKRLVVLSRESTVERALLNYVAARREHRDWLLATAPRRAVYDAAQVMDASVDHAARRDIASLASRVIAEMALCASPCNSGGACTETDLDFLIAEVSTLVRCANQSDALYYGLSDRPPAMGANGCFDFDASALQVSSPMMGERWRREFRDAAEQPDEVEELADLGFTRAFAAEFGLTLEEYGEFVMRVAMEAVDGGAPLMKLARDEVVGRLRDVGAVDADRTFKALVLCARDRWDEGQPSNAKARDWYPWRFNRRLSVLRRPLVQLSRTDDATVILAPTILADALQYLAMAKVGGRPAALFDSPEMVAFVGRAADRNGHEFARKAEKRLAELGWTTEREVSLTRFGGADALGDVDILCWCLTSGVVYVIECKSLRFDSTLGEIGERLREFAVGVVKEKRTPLQKHLDRMAFLQANCEALAHYTGIPETRLRLRSALVTEGLGALQFGGDARKMLDVVTDYESLGRDISSTRQ